MGSQSNLIRKQYLISEDNIQKIERLASDRGTSAADIVRQAIDAYDPHGAEQMEAPELMELVSEKLKEAIAATKKANRKVTKTLKALDTVTI
jgi:predicted DNA-binding protein